MDLYGGSSVDCKRNQSILSAFESASVEVEERQRLRAEFWEWANGLEVLVNKLSSVLTGIFSVRYDVAITCKAAYEVLDEIRTTFERGQKEGTDLWFGIKLGGDLTDHLNSLLSQLSKSCVILRYVEMDELPSREDVADTLGLPMGSFELNVHSYLDGVLNIAEDLVRFGTVGVGFGYYSRPIEVGEFLNKVYMGFISIGKKSDKLKNRLRGFENEIKKLEHVMFEVSVRNLTNITTE